VTGSGTPLPLEGLKVVDAATLFAGPVIATIMGDYGADVIKFEHPKGDNLRSLGWEKDGVSLWWALIGRNKRSITLNLSHPRGQELAKRILADADVFIEGFRPGTLERWNLAPEDLHAINPGLVIVRTSGFGQTGPYSSLPGFGTLAEAMRQERRELELFRERIDAQLVRTRRLLEGRSGEERLSAVACENLKAMGYVQQGCE